MNILLLSIEQLSNPQIYDEVLQILPDMRKKTIAKLKPINSKHLSAAAGILLCYAYNDFAGKKNTPLPDISYTEHNKPYIDNNQDFHFNLSHSGSYAAICYGKSEVGIDIQKDSDISDSMAKRILSSNEYEYYISISNIEEKHLFINKIWCIKEAYIKYIGTGLSFDMKNLDIQFEADEKTNEYGVVEDKTFEYSTARFKYYQVNGSTLYHLAVCLGTEKLPQSYTKLNLLQALTKL